MLFMLHGGFMTFHYRKKQKLSHFTVFKDANPVTAISQLVLRKPLVRPVVKLPLSGG